MILREHIRLAKSSIRGSRFRSFLTMLGIIIGVVSVITTVSLGEGIKHQVVGQINHLGTDIITVRPGKLVNRNDAGEITGVNLFFGAHSTNLTDHDIQSIAKNTNIEASAPLSIVTGVPKAYDKELSSGIVVATTTDLPKIINQKVEFGNFINSDETNKKVAVIGLGVAEKLFNEAVPIGQNVTIRGQEFIVKGVFEEFKTNPITPELDFNNAVFIPYDTGKAISNNNMQLYEVLVKPKNANRSDKIADEITGTLKANHGGQEDFTVLKQEETLEVASNVVNIITTAVAGIAAVSLLVGGIGIMNVMLVSVSERTREIGVRKAVGATNAQIRTQFMIEAVVLSVWGALTGVFLAGVINLLLRIMTDLQPIVTLDIVILATLVSSAVGIIFGVIPAEKAARKDPIEALRAF